MPFTIKPPEGTAGKAWPAIAVGLFVAFGEHQFTQLDDSNDFNANGM